MIPLLNLPIQKITIDSIKVLDIELKIVRADQIHALASGNKIYKLSPILDYVKLHDIKQILSFGGAYSNHIHALSLLAKQREIESIGLIRGEAEYAKNPTLRDAQQAGMHLEFINREEYKQRNDYQYLKKIQNRYPDALIIPEGGSSQLAIKGCAQMARDINYAQMDQQSDILAIASGTGTTAAGLAFGLAAHQQLYVYSVLKDKTLNTRINSLINAEQDDTNQSRYVIHQADYGGYAKLDKVLLDFILSFLEQTGILLDPIYTSKMCCKVIQQIEAGEYRSGQSIALIHSGGLQGWRGMQKRVQAMAGINAWGKISSYL